MGSLLRRRYQLPTLALNAVAPGEITPEPPILEHVGMPPYLGSPLCDDLGALLRIARATQPRLVIELGTAYGNVAANICRQCPEATVYTVNALPAEQTGAIVTHELGAEEIGTVYRAAGFESRVVQIYANTLDLDLSPHLPSCSAGLAIIDACHDTRYVLNDFHKVRPFVRRGGVVLFHDTHPSLEEHLVGSYIACMLLRRQGFDIRHLADTWWGVWQAP